MKDTYEESQEGEKRDGLKQMVPYRMQASVACGVVKKKKKRKEGDGRKYFRSNDTELLLLVVFKLR